MQLVLWCIVYLVKWHDPWSYVFNHILQMNPENNVRIVRTLRINMFLEYIIQKKAMIRLKIEAGV